MNVITKVSCNILVNTVIVLTTWGQVVENARYLRLCGANSLNSGSLLSSFAGCDRIAEVWLTLDKDTHFDRTKEILKPKGPTIVEKLGLSFSQSPPNDLAFRRLCQFLNKSTRIKEFVVKGFPFSVCRVADLEYVPCDSISFYVDDGDDEVFKQALVSLRESIISVNIYTHNKSLYSEPHGSNVNVHQR